MSHPFADFYRGKRVLVTGHTGFEGGWTVTWLKLLGAQVCGYGLPPATRPNFFDATILDRGMTSIFGDIRDRNSLANTFTELQPEIVIHCAAQTSPQSALREPVDAFSTNVMGTAHVLEEARLTNSVRTVVLVNGDSRNQHEVNSTPGGNTSEANDLLGATISAAELVRSAFEKSYFQKSGAAVATARTADAVGGGDWREGRVVPDLVRGIMSGERSPVSKEHKLRIWHVLEPVCAWLLLAQNLFQWGQKFAGVWDFAPSDQDGTLDSELVDKFTALWSGDATAKKTSSKAARNPGSNPIKAPAELGWSPMLSADEALAWTVEWYRAFCSEPSSTLHLTQGQIQEYMRRSE
jgi:CDP-glucose 4,6-dehydratase